MAAHVHPAYGAMSPATAHESAAVGRYFGGLLASGIRVADAAFRRVSGPSGTRHAVIASMLERHGVRGKSVNDLGCGRGDASLAAARLGATVVGVDLVARAIAAARDKAAAAGLSSRVQFGVGDITSMVLAPADVTVLAGVIEYYSDAEGLLRRVCAATTELAIVVDTRGPASRRLLRHVLKRLEGFTLVYRAPDQVASMMKKSAFEEVERVAGHSFVAMAFLRTDGAR